jgi:hypothetical protein
MGLAMVHGQVQGSRTVSTWLGLRATCSGIDRITVLLIAFGNYAAFFANSTLKIKCLNP